MDVTLKPELERLIADEVKSGRSADPGEFLDKAVYHYLVARDLGEEYSREEIEEKIARGLAQAERGETVDGETAFRELRAFAAERRRQLL
jgi:antitoxin ParD1/3/4